jgi:O-antigen/teichoic acid export membrane protein|tara:strand:- start:794 stop:2062 length:1269 start_codon:yes stop_codon:yes gene_type:complete
MIKRLLANSLVKSSMVYGVSNLVNASVPFLLLPYLTSSLTPYDYGIIAMFQVLFNLTMPFVGIGSLASITNQFYNLDKENYKAYNFSIVSIHLVTSLPILLGFLLFGDFISDVSSFPKLWLWAVLLHALNTQIIEIVLACWRLQDKALNFGSLKVTRTIIELILTFLFIGVYSYSWDGRILAQVGTSFIFVPIAIYFLLHGKYIKWSLKKEDIRYAVKFGLPLIPHALGATLITYSDRLFITNMVGLEEMGFYAVGYQIGMVIALVQNSFNQAWIPWLYSRLKENKLSVKKQVVKITYVYFGVILVIVAAVYLMLPLVFELMVDDSFIDALDIVIWIALGFAVNGMYKMVVGYLFYTEKTGIIGISTFSTALLNLVLNYLFILQFDAIGAAYATFVSFFVQFVLIWMVSARNYKMPWFSFYK